jgi:hypothetical protein
MYTYMVNPLGVGGNGDGGQQRDNLAAGGPVAAPPAGPGAADAGRPQQQQQQQQSFSKITGWELRIVMEYCNSVGAPTLRTEPGVESHACLGSVPVRCSSIMQFGLEDEGHGTIVHQSPGVISQALL